MKCYVKIVVTLLILMIAIACKRNNTLPSTFSEQRIETPFKQTPLSDEIIGLITNYKQPIEQQFIFLLATNSRLTSALTVERGNVMVILDSSGQLTRTFEFDTIADFSIDEITFDEYDSLVVLVKSIGCAYKIKGNNIKKYSLESPEQYYKLKNPGKSEIIYDNTLWFYIDSLISNGPEPFPKYCNCFYSSTDTTLIVVGINYISFCKQGVVERTQNAPKTHFLTTKILFYVSSDQIIYFSNFGILYKIDLKQGKLSELANYEDGLYSYAYTYSSKEHCIIGIIRDPVKGNFQLGYFRIV